MDTFSKSSSIKIKIILYFIGIVAVIAFFMLLVTMVRTKGQLLNMQQKKAQGMVSNLASVCIDLMDEGKEDKLGQVLREAKKNDSDVDFILVLDNNAIAVSASKREEKGRAFGSAFDQKALSVEKMSIMRDPSRKNVYEVVLPLFSAVDETKKLGVIRAGYSTAAIQQALLNIAILSVAMGLLALLAGVILYYFLIDRSIVRPLSQLIVAAKQIADGDFTQQEIIIRTNDEIGELSMAFTKMSKSLKDIVSQVRGTSDKVASSLQELSATFEEMNTATQEISNAIIQVSKGASNQAQQVEGTFEIMEKSAQSLKEVVVNAQSANTAVGRTSTHSETARNAANEAVNRIQRLTVTVLETTAVVQSLGKMSQQISEITETITSIADQTNLLALNAAIEAARAGEAGRGFAVVAEEVRKLAEGAAEAVRKIGGLIKSIQNETTRAVTSIEISSKEVQGGKEQVAKIAEILGEINLVAQEATSFVNQIVAAGEERVKETEHVVSAINEVATIAKESAATIQEVSSTSQEQTASMQEVSASAQELARLAIDLKELVGRFKLEKRGA